MLCFSFFWLVHIAKSLMDEHVYNEILARLEEQDYDTTKLFKSLQQVEGGKT